MSERQPIRHRDRIPTEQLPTTADVYRLIRGFERDHKVKPDQTGSTIDLGLNNRATYTKGPRNKTLTLALRLGTQWGTVSVGNQGFSLDWADHNGKGEGGTAIHQNNPRDTFTAIAKMVAVFSPSR